MEIIEKILNNDLLMKLIYSLIAIIIGIIIYNVVNKIIEKTLFKGNIKIFDTKRAKTYFKLLKSINRYVILIIVVIALLKIFGINVTSMLAGIGIIGIIIGFAIQDALKDIIKGLDILTENYYQVGDVIKYKTITGKVLSIGLKTTKIEDIYTMNLISLSNRNIDNVEIVSHMINIDIPLPYELKASKAEKIIDDIVKTLNEQEKVEKCEYRGVNNFSASSIDYQIKVYSKPTDKVQVRRDSLTLILKKLEEHNISIPYQQIDLHNK